MNFLPELERSSLRCHKPRGPPCRKKRSCRFLSRATIRTLIFEAIEAEETRGPRGLLADKNPAAMQIHVRSAFSKFVAPFLHSSATSPQHLAATKYRLLLPSRPSRIWPSSTRGGRPRRCARRMSLRNYFRMIPIGRPD